LATKAVACDASGRIQTVMNKRAHLLNILLKCGFWITLVLCLNVNAGSIDPIHFDNAVDEKRYQQLILDIRCPTCQNQAISDSNALIAGDLRRSVADQIKAGRSDQEIVMFMRERYGDFIYYEPPLNGFSLALWMSPFLMIIFGFLLFKRRINRVPQVVLDNALLSELEQELLSGDTDPDNSGINKIVDESAVNQGGEKND
jgi:cytochrome c-type biogenesis protein CcmH